MAGKTTLAFLLSCVCGFCQLAAPDWEKADRAVVRLSPSKFPQLPFSVRHELNRRGCKIPQPWDGGKPRNIIRGRFFSYDELDGAVLCSVNRVSSILIFRNASPMVVADLARQPDVAFLQGVGGDRIGYSRGLAAVGRDVILRDYTAYGGQRPPPIDHQGIDDAFLEKASAIRHFCRGKWLELQGAD